MDLSDAVAWVKGAAVDAFLRCKKKPGSLWAARLGKF